MTDEVFKTGLVVRAEAYGIGSVVADMGQTVVVRFESGIEECLRSHLTPVADIADSLSSRDFSPPLRVVLRGQAEAIISVNNAWGVFSRSRIDLLPHQLWVCRKVVERWPIRWLVADDVGLGKTIEAGLILSALMTRDRIRRLLVICPASLVEQWQYRLRTMFDIRTAIYASTADTPRSDFWNVSPMVVASLQTLRKDSSDRHQRMLQADPWDLAIVDEAHHLNADEQAGPTLGFKLVRNLVETQRVRSMVFFTGTPHRGKPFGFFSLLSLLRPDDFGPKKPVADQLRLLPEIMIRNNKQNVTDLQGKLLFQKPEVYSRTYAYSEAEDAFYKMLTEFIVTGKAYASSLGGRDGRAVMLVLISMQKLASSSVAAILRALQGRLARITAAVDEIRRQQADQSVISEHEEAEANYDFDQASSLDEKIAELSLSLMEDEKEWLEKLIDAAETVANETKIEAILEEVRSYGMSASVLFFTEYKATQSLLMSRLLQEFGAACVTFINGDGEARGVIGTDGHSLVVQVTREEASDRFNVGHVRFLVSTEAGGEGIDLQGNCHTLIHVDLPWNPMRLHQRVGRLNRYGQQSRVRVTNFRNPSTVESRIWDKLTTKIEHINQALRRVMADPEDMYQLVLGMTPSSVFRDILAEGADVPPEAFDSWFDRASSQFGGQDVIDTVTDLIGNCARFDFQQVSERLPKVDLPDLKNFLIGMLVHNHRRCDETDSGLSFKTPEAWLVEPSILPEYRDMVLDRDTVSVASPERLLGVGHRLVDMALEQARSLDGRVAVVPDGMLDVPLIVCRVFDRVTTRQSTQTCPVICGVELRDGGLVAFPDWELLRKLNGLSPRRLERLQSHETPGPLDSVRSRLEETRLRAMAHAATLGLGYTRPDCELLAVLLPSQPLSLPKTSSARKA